MEMIEAAAVLLRRAKQLNGTKTDARTNRQIASRVLAECRADYPEVSDETWSKASQYLAKSATGDTHEQRRKRKRRNFQL